MATYTFNTPTVREGPAGGGRLFMFFKLNKGLSVVKSGGIYSTTRYILDTDVPSYQEVYRGGYNHTVSQATKDALIAASIGITESNFTVQ